MKKLFIFLVVFLFGFNSLWAQKIEISGHIFGCNNKPLINAFLNYWDAGVKDYISVKIGEDGSFNIKTDKKFLSLVFSGVNHRTVRLPLIINKSSNIYFDITLPSYKYKESFDNVRLYGNFNNWRAANSLIPQKSGNNVYYWDFNSDLDTIQYQLLSATQEPDNHVINGTIADAYTFDPYRNVMCSVILRKSKTTHIEFDPSKLINGSHETIISSKDPELSEIRILNEDIKSQEYSDILKRKAQHDTTFGNDLQKFAAYIKDKLKNEKDEFVRGYYYIKYLDYFSKLHIGYFNPIVMNKIDSSLFVNALREINPASVLWRAFNTELIYNIQAPLDSYNREQYRDYVDQVIKINKDNEVLANCLWLKAEYLKNDIHSSQRKMKREREHPSLGKDSLQKWAKSLVEDYKRKNNLNDEQIKDSSKVIKALFDELLKRKIEERKNQMEIQSSEVNASGINFSEVEKISRQCLERLVSEFPNTERGRVAVNEFFTIKKDDPVPGYELASIDERSTKFTNTSMKGKFYLLDFWASWCAPCVWKIPELNQIHEKLKGYNFDILSISLDENDEDIVTFRKSNPMPWLHTRLSKGFDDELAKKFGVIGIPKVFLVSSDGRILANDQELRGQHFVEKVIKLVKGEN